MTNKVHPSPNTSTTDNNMVSNTYQSAPTATTNNNNITQIHTKQEGNLFHGKTLDFFVNISILREDFPKSHQVMAILQEARGYLILLSDAVENNLKIATLIDGTSIDFLFGSKYLLFTNTQKAKVHEIKQFIRHLEFIQQEMICEFYHQVYQELVKFLEKQDTCCGCLWQASLGEKMTENIQQQFHYYVQGKMRQSAGK